MKSFSLVILSLILLSTSAHAQRKLGYINMDEVMAIIPDTRAAQQTLQGLADSLAKVDGAIQQEFVTKRDAFFQDSANMDETKKEAQRKVLQQLLAQDQRFRADAKAQLDSTQEVLTTAVQSKAEAAVKAAAKANGYTYVFRKTVAAENNHEFVILGPKGDDLLPLVKKQLGLSTQ